MSTQNRMSVSAYAKQLGIAKRSVQKAIETGKIKAGYDSATKKIIVAVANKEYGNAAKIIRPKAGVSKHQVAKKVAKIAATKTATTTDEEKPVGTKEIEEMAIAEGINPEDIVISADLDLSELMRRRELIGALLDKNKLLEQSGLLVRKADVETVLYAYGNQLKKALQAIPQRIIDQALSAGNKVEAMAIIENEINSVLELYANGVEITKPEN